MPSKHESPVDLSARASELRFRIERTLEGCQDLSELLHFVASRVGDPLSTDSLLTDAEAAARVWRGIERVLQEQFKDLLLAQQQTDALHACVSVAHGGAR